MNPITTTAVRLDGIANVLAGVALAVLAAPAAEVLGLDATWPMLLAAAGLVGFGVEHLVTASRGTGHVIPWLVAGDVTFAVAVVALAITNPFEAGTGARWVLAGLGDLALTVGVAKLWLHRRDVRGHVRMTGVAA